METGSVEFITFYGDGGINFTCMFTPDDTNSTEAILLEGRVAEKHMGIQPEGFPAEVLYKELWQPVHIRTYREKCPKKGRHGVFT